MAEAGKQVAAAFAVVAGGETVETEAIDQQVRNFACRRFPADVAVQLHIDDRNFVTGECAGVLASFTQ